MKAPTRPNTHRLPGVWSELDIGHRLTVVKLGPDGSEAARYPGDVVAIEPEGSWVVVCARWTRPTIELDGLAFDPGDDLLEWFSPRHPFNAFAVMAPGGDLKGWYANVTHPARLDMSGDRPTLFWHDLYVDLVGVPDGRFTIRDDDELRDSALERLDPRLHRQIMEARAELIRRFERRLPPFIPAAAGL